MSESSDFVAPVEREIGRVVGEEPGPTLIAVGGIHGNEHAGVTAARRVLSILERRHGAVRGEFVAFAGNLGAMRLGKRYQLRDLNRVWTDARIADLERKAKEGRAQDLDAEETEQLELLRCIRGAIARARGPIYLVDLHTTSAHGLPFILFGDTLRQRRFASAVPLPIVLGLEEHLEGVLSAYWTTKGVTTFGVEGGQHDDPGSVDNLEAVLLLGAEQAGLFGSGVLAETGAAHALLERRRGSLPRVMEVVSRHAITPSDQFVMEPGFMNLARVHGRRLLARDRNGPIHAPKDGFVILPLYQGQGGEGFFWGREVSATRLRLAEALRTMKVDRFLDLLPGVRRNPDRPTQIEVDDRVARLYPSDVFTMFGYRRHRRGASVTSTTIERQPD